MKLAIILLFLVLIVVPTQAQQKYDNVSIYGYNANVIYSAELSSSETTMFNWTTLDSGLMSSTKIKPMNSHTAYLVLIVMIRGE